MKPNLIKNTNPCMEVPTQQVHLPHEGSALSASLMVLQQVNRELNEKFSELYERLLPIIPPSITDEEFGDAKICPVPPEMSEVARFISIEVAGLRITRDRITMLLDKLDI